MMERTFSRVARGGEPIMVKLLIRVGVEIQRVTTGHEEGLEKRFMGIEEETWGS